MDSGGSEKKPVRVTIFNQPYTVRTSGDPREIEELARLIDDLMAGIASKTGDSEPARVAVLACLHLADRLRLLEGELSVLKRGVEEKYKELSLLLDHALEPAGE
jgi:cell division protein ZapA